MFPFDTSPSMPNPWQQIVLDRVKFGLTQAVGSQVADSMTADWRAEHFADRIVASFRTTLLAQALPPECVDSAEHFTVPQFATWRDHLFATYRQRWWGRWMPQPKFVDHPMTHQVRVAVRSQWTYPQAVVRLPDGYGPAVLMAAVDHKAEVTPW